MIELDNVKVLLLEDTDFQPVKDNTESAQLTPEADRKVTLAEIAIFGNKVLKNRHSLD